MEQKWSTIQQGNTLEFSRKTVFTKEVLHNFINAIGAKEGMKIADIGCGTGCFTRYIYSGLNQNANVIGVDQDKTLLEYANYKKQEEKLGDGLTFIYGDAYDLPFQDNELDVITDHTLMINLKDPTRFIEEEYRVLKPGGMVSTISFLSDYTPPQRLISKPEYQLIYEVENKTKALLKKHVFNQSPIGANDINIYNIVKRFEAAGFKEVQVSGVYPIFSPDDFRNKEMRQEWLLQEYNLQKMAVGRFLREIDFWEKEGLTKEMLTQTLDLLEDRYHFECENTTWIFVNSMELIISARKI